MPPERDEEDDAHEEFDGSRLMGRIRRRLRGEARSPEEEDDLRERDLFTSLLSTSERARVEIVRMVAKEARLYIEALQLREVITELVGSHSLELHLSLSLKPKPRAKTEPEEEADPAEPEPA